MKVLRPVGKKNKLNGGYSSSHKGYDHDEEPDPNYYSSFAGVVVQAKSSETGNWVNTGTLTTKDYGNYIKIKATVDGKVVYQLGAHFQVGSVLVVGTQVQVGQVVAQIGNTGNSTGPHCHTEYRDSANVNFPVEFIDKPETNVDKKQQIIDAYLGARPNLPPSDDEINARLQENKNQVEIIRDILGGDGNAKAYWMERWGISATDTNWQEIARSYQDTFDRLKTIYGLTPADNTEEVLGFATRSQERIKELEKAIEPKVIYKLEGKDYEKVARLFNLILILEK